jgi:hypothetical protein
MATTTTQQQQRKPDNRRPSQNPTEPNQQDQPTAYVSDLNVIAPSAMEAQERAQIDVQIATARRYPRDLVRARAKMLQFATLDQDTAQSCFYTLKRDGKVIQGPSIRLAEIALACYGNIRGAARVIENDGRKLTAQGVCIDLENNVALSMEVQRRITNSSGYTYSEDMQIVTGNAANSIALRNVVFKVIPRALIDPVFEAAMDFAIGKGKPLAERWQRAVDAFAGMGVQPDQLLKFVKKADATKLTDADFKTLIGLHTAIRDGEITLETAFAEDEPTTATGEPVKEEDAPKRKEIGPFAPSDFAKEEYQLLQDIWQRAGKGNKARFDAFLGKWDASREDLRRHLEEAAANR